MNNYFSVTPMSQEFSVSPGNSYTGKIKIVNPANSTTDFHYRVYVSPYSVIGESYGVDLNTESSYTQISKWISIDNPVGVIAPNGVQEVSFSIAVPENAPGGGQYAAIMISQDSEESTTGSDVSINTVFEVASLIYVDVEGEITRGGEILENRIPVFVTEPQITLSALISNSGNVHENAVICIKAANLMTGEEIVPTENTDGYYSELVIPETTRFIQRNIIENLPNLGIVQVEQTIYYNGALSTETRQVIICPIWFLFLIIFVLISAVGVILRIVLKHRKRKSGHYSESDVNSN